MATDKLAGVDKESFLTYEQAQQLFSTGAMGTREFREWLANRYPDFNKVRDSDVDADIIAIAKLRQKRMEAEAVMGE